MMKTVLRRIGICTLLILVAGTVVVAKDWRGIILLKSTREDVERLLGRPNRSSERSWYYTLPKEIVVFHFQTRTCDKCGWGWNVPLGTVLSIGVIPRGKHRKEEYLSANDSKQRDAGGGFIHFRDHSGDLTVETYENLVTLLDYSPGESHNNLQCPQSERCIGHPLFKFDEYEKPSFEDEKARLDNFVLALNNDFLRGTIQVLGPNKKVRQTMMKSAARAKRYLVKQRGFEEKRLLIVDGGFSELTLTRLSIHPIGGPYSLIYLFPEKDP